MGKQYICQVDGYPELDSICKQAWKVAQLLGSDCRSWEDPSVIVQRREYPDRSIRINATDTEKDVRRKMRGLLGYRTSPK